MFSRRVMRGRDKSAATFGSIGRSLGRGGAVPHIARPDLLIKPTGRLVALRDDLDTAAQGEVCVPCVVESSGVNARY